MTSATAVKPAVKRSHHKNPAAPISEKKELFNRVAMSAPASQKTISGDKDLKKTPPFEVVDAAETFMERKFEANNAKQKVESAAEALLKELNKAEMTQVTVSDHDGIKRRIVVRQGDERLKVEKDTSSGLFMPDGD